MFDWQWHLVGSSLGDYDVMVYGKTKPLHETLESSGVIQSGVHSVLIICLVSAEMLLKTASDVDVVKQLQKFRTPSDQSV